MAILLLATSVAHAKFVTTEDTTEQQQSAPVVVKAEQKVKGFYMGAGASTTEFESLDVDLYDAGGNGSSVKFMAGYQFSRVFALEGQYTKYGDITESLSDYSWSPTAVSLTANLGYTFRNGLRPFGLAKQTIL